MKMGRRPRCSSVTSRPTFMLARRVQQYQEYRKWSGMRPPRALPAAHFDRDERHVISGTGHKLASWSAAIPVEGSKTPQ